MLSLDYWNKRPGEDYRVQQQGRRVGTNPPYELQELWLKKFLDDFSANRKCQKIRVLDYGCGYGRIADIVCELETVEYFGFDISRSMTAPFRAKPPPRLQSNIDDRLRVADQLADAFSAAEKFDVILTVSVLIHNQPGAVKKILAAMFDRLAPDGVVVLTENPHTAVSVLENFWHGGCWCHSFARYFDGRADVEIIDNFADRHGIYIARASANPRQSRFVYRAAPEAGAEALDLQSVLLRGLDRPTVAAEYLISEWSATGQDHGALVGRVHDLEERLVTETSKLRDEVELARARFAERQQIREDLAFAANRTAKRHDHAPDHDSARAESGPSSAVEWNAPQDTRYSHSLPGFDRVLQVFHKEWFGIRAAAGSLPGAKLAIPADVDLSHDHVLGIYDAISLAGYDRIVFHGSPSPNVGLPKFFTWSSTARQRNGTTGPSAKQRFRLLSFFRLRKSSVFIL